MRVNENNKIISVALFNHSRGNDGDKEEHRRGYSTVLAPSGQILIAKLNFAVYQPKKGRKIRRKAAVFIFQSFRRKQLSLQEQNKTKAL